MEDLSRYWGINRTLALICCLVCTFLPAEGKTISRTVGSTIRLHCSNESISTLKQLTWKMNGALLISFMSQGPSYFSEEAYSLNLYMSKLESQLYALIIESVQQSHAGNYTCETNTITGLLEQHWELIVTEKAEKWDKLVIVVAAVSCVCFLIFIFTWTLMRRRSRHRENSHQSPAAEMWEQTEDIYENCLRKIEDIYEN